VNSVVAFWSYALAACAFASVVVWRLRAPVDRTERLLIGSCATTAVWATIAAVYGRTDPMTMVSGTLRNLIWMVLLYEMSGGVRGATWSGMRLVFAAVALSIGMHLGLSIITFFVALTPDQYIDVLTTGSLLRITSSAGALVLVHNVYGQAAPESRLRIRGPMLGLTLMWGYDLNLATLAYLEGVGSGTVDELFRLRGIFMAIIAPLFASSVALRIKLSRAATFQSLSMVAIGAYLCVMVVLAGALRHTHWNWGSVATALLLIVLSVAAVVLPLSQWARGWVKVKVAKHLFEHRYDYRSEWLGFTETLGRSGEDAPPLGDRIVKALADISDAPGGLLLTADASGAIADAASFNWTGSKSPAGEVERDVAFWRAVESRGRIVRAGLP